jgi:hypothetical protein
MIDWHYHGIAAQHSAAHDVSLCQPNGLLRAKGGFEKMWPNYHSSESNENDGQDQPAAAKGRPEIEIVGEKFKADGQVEEDGRHQEAQHKHHWQDRESRNAPEPPDEPPQKSTEKTHHRRSSSQT